MIADSSPRAFSGGWRAPHPLRLVAAVVVSMVLVNLSNDGLSMLGRFVFSAPDDFCAFLPRWSVPVSVAAILATTIAWILLTRWARSPARQLYRGLRISVGVALAFSLLTMGSWRSMLGVVTLMLMILVGATVTYLALTRIAPARCYER